MRLRLPSGAVYRWEFERDGQPIMFDPDGHLTLDDGPLIREAALGGMGIAYVLHWEVAEDIAAGRLVQLLDAWTPPYPGLCLYYPGRRHVLAGLKTLVALVQEHASAHRQDTSAR